MNCTVAGIDGLSGKVLHQLTTSSWSQYSVFEQRGNATYPLLCVRDEYNRYLSAYSLDNVGLTLVNIVRWNAQFASYELASNIRGGFTLIQRKTSSPGQNYWKGIDVLTNRTLWALPSNPLLDGSWVKAYPNFSAQLYAQINPANQAQIILTGIATASDGTGVWYILAGILDLNLGSLSANTSIIGPIEGMKLSAVSTNGYWFPSSGNPVLAIQIGPDLKSMQLQWFSFSPELSPIGSGMLDSSFAGQGLAMFSDVTPSSAVVVIPTGDGVRQVGLRAIKYEQTGAGTL